MNGLIDIHCQMVPGVDDGSKNFRMTRQMLILQKRQHVEKIIVTPHMRVGMFEAPQAEINRRFMKMKELVTRMGIGIDLYLGCEYHSSSSMVSNLNEGKRPTLAGSRFVLVEFSAAHSYEKIRSQIYDLIVGGYIPVIAHIERYPALMKDLDRVEDLIDMGALMQISASAVIGDAGWKAKRLCKKLIQEDFVDYIASDAHDPVRRRPNLGECADYLEKKMGRAYVNKIMRENPRKILGGR